VSKRVYEGIAYGTAMITRFHPGSFFRMVAFVGPLVAVFAPNGMVPLAAAAALGCLATAPRSALPRGWNRWLLMSLIVLPAWAAMTAFWAVVPRGSVLAALQLAVVFTSAPILVGAAGTVPEAVRPGIAKALVAGAVIAWGLLLALGLGIDLLTPTFRVAYPDAQERVAMMFGRAFVVLMVLAPAVILAGWRLAGWRLAGPLAAMTAASILVTHSIAVKAGTILMILVAVAAWRSVRKTILGARILLIALMVSAPLLPALFPPPHVSWETMQWLPSSAHHRMTIWQFTAARVAEKPIFGWGMDAARSIPGGEIRLVMVRGDNERFEQLMPLHPHNAALQVWLELGAIGASIATVLFAALVGLPAREANPAVRAGMAASLAAALTAAMVSFGAWQSWWLCSLVLTAALWASLRSRA
jgi:exopolysaccharide production protein ExoQ